MCVKPRKPSVSGFLRPYLLQFSAANGPNSKRRVLPGYSLMFEAEGV